MRRVVAAIIMLLLIATAASAANQSSWRIFMKADNGFGMSPAPGAFMGVYPTSLEGLDPEDLSPYSGFFVDYPGTTIHVAAVVPGAGLYPRSIKAPTMPSPEKTWDFCVAANVNSTANVIRLLAYTSSALPTPTFNGVGVRYLVRMLDNKGMPGAPANGTAWELPIPTTNNGTAPYWNSPVNLPVIKVSAATNDALLAEGYKLQFVQTVVPEPSSLLALGAGLMGMVGAIRRRR